MNKKDKFWRSKKELYNMQNYPSEPKRATDYSISKRQTRRN